jgi:RNA polymerase sigma-70 factor (ECF subfamily)
LLFSPPAFDQTRWNDVRLHFLRVSFEAAVEKKNATVTGSPWSYRIRSRLSASDDQADVERVLAGDIDAFERIVERWQSPLINLAYRFCRDRSRAEDMAQEAFLRAYRALGQWRKDAAFSTWLFALATNLYRTELRRIPARNVALDDVAELRDSRAIDAGLEDRDRDGAVRRAVLRLPARYRDALVLFYFHGMDIGATALSLALPQGTVKARLARGRQILAGKLAHLWTAQRIKELP